jgi:hypothetical protein
VWVINADGSVSRIDPASNRIVQTVRGASVSAIASGVEGTWAIENTDVGSIAQLTPITTGSAGAYPYRRRREPRR